MKEKITRILLLLGIVLCVLVLICIVYYLMHQEEMQARQNLKYINDSEQWNREEVKYPTRANEIKNVYEGDLDIKDIGKSMYYFTTQVIPKYYNTLRNATDEEVVAYYEENKKVIALDTGIDEEEDFVQLIQNVQKLQTDVLSLKSFRISEGSVKKQSSYTNASLYILYENNEEIGFEVKIFKQIKENMSTVVYTSL